MKERSQQDSHWFSNYNFSHGWTRKDTD